MSARYSKTSSRGLAIVTETVNGSMRRSRARAYLAGRRLRRRAGDAHRAAVLAPEHELGVDWLLAAERPAQLAAQPPVVVVVDALAHQWRPAGVRAAPALSRASA